MSIIVAGYNQFRQLIEHSNKLVDGHSVICPPSTSRLNPAQLLSYSAYNTHTIWATEDGKLYASGTNADKQILNTLPPKQFSEPFEFELLDSNGTPLKPLSVVCGDSYTLYLTQPRNYKEVCQLFYVHKTNQGIPLLLNLGKRHPVGIFGGQSRCAAVDEDGDVLLITDSIVISPKHSPFVASLPENEKASYVACCENVIYVLSLTGKIYSSSIPMNGSILSFSEVDELHGIQFNSLSGTYAHCVAVSSEGNVYVKGSTEDGRTGLKTDLQTLNTFTKLPPFSSRQIAFAYAGKKHTIFQNVDGKLFGCGNNFCGPLLTAKPGKLTITPIESTVKLGASFCIAGDCLSAAFIDCEAPPYCPNRRITDFTSITIEPEHDFEALLIQTRAELEKEQEARQQAEQKIEQLHAEIEQLNEQIKDLQSNKFKPCKIPTISADDVSQYQKVKTLGKGDISKVTKMSKNNSYVIKVLNSEIITKQENNENGEIVYDTEKLNNYFNEYEELNQLNHPNIIKAFGFFNGNNEQKPFIALEYCPYNLKSAIKILNNVEIVGIVYEICDTMKFLHHHGHIHRCLKPNNILLDEKKHVKLSDFGISALLTETEQVQNPQQTLSSFQFIAPELITGQSEISEKCDVYSFGMTLYFLLTKGELPKVNPAEMVTGIKPVFPDTTNEMAQGMIQKCLSIDPANRPSFNDLVNEIRNNDFQLIDGIEDDIETLKDFLQI